MKRLSFLDWTRGIAVLLMIPCHTFSAFTRPELYGTAAYSFSQSFGGMAAPLFLLLAGVTFAFLMDKLDRGNAAAGARMKALVKRGGYVLMLAYLFRLSHALPRWPMDFDSIWKVDILNAMGAGMMVLAVLGLVPARIRAQAAFVAGLLIASAAPLVSQLDWSGVPPQVKEYFVPNQASFPMIPWTAYIAFGIAAGLVIRRTPRESLERVLGWGSLLGFGMVIGGQYFSNLTYSLYDKVDFWTDSPALVIIRTGLCFLTIAAGYLWTEYLAGPKPGWVQVFGQTSLLVYWVHVVLVYGAMADFWKESMSIPQATAMTVLVIALMIGLAYARLWQIDWSKKRKLAKAASPSAP